MLALLSSGLDSSVAMALAHQSGGVKLAVTFDYGQRAAQRETEHAAKIARHLNISHQVITLPWFKELASKSALLSREALIPQLTLNQLSQRDVTSRSARAVWVPNRNGVFIEIGACVAESQQMSEVVVGFNREEAETFPDNSLGYLEAISSALFFSTSNRVRIVSPTVAMNKSEILKKAKALGFPFSLLWSCYENGNKMCGRCESCMRLKRALKENEVSHDELFEHLSF